MNPPAAIQNAMGRERKPFTYTPGGLDLSEIKSERMARRLMRNAMSQGVPDPPSPSVQSPTTPSPGFPPAANYHNLPVQVFPAFQLPPNPKVLLRTRSTPYQPREGSVDRITNGNVINGRLAEDTQDNNNNNNNKSYQRRISAEVFPTDLDSNLLNTHPPIQSIPLTLPTKVQAPRLGEEPWVERTEKRLTPSIILEPCLRMPSEILQSKTEDKNVKSKKEESVEVEATVKISQPKKTISTSVQIERQLLPDGTVEETKTTTTNTIIDGKIEDSKVKKETRILSEEEAKAVIEEISGEEDEEIEEENVTETTQTTNQQNGKNEVKVNSSITDTKSSVLTTETKKETKETKESNQKSTNTKQRITRAESGDDEEEEIEEEEREVKEKVIVGKSKESETVKKETSTVQNESYSVKKETGTESKTQIVSKKETEVENIESEEEEDEYEEIEEEVEEEEEEEKEKIVNTKENNAKIEIAKQTNTEELVITTHDYEPDEVEEIEVEEEEEEEVVEEKNSSKNSDNKTEKKSETSVTTEKSSEKVKVSLGDPKAPTQDRPIEIHVAKSVTDKGNVTKRTETTETKTETITSTPVPEVHTTTKKETTEISSTLSDIPFGNPISTQTELHRIENVITINKTTKCQMDNSYDQLTQQGLPTVKTYFAPNRERISTSPQPAKPYTPNFTVSEKKPERRHSLLLERLSTERQFATSENYQNTYNSTNHNIETDTNQWNQEPQSEVVVASNIKPSSISNSQWYQAQQSIQSAPSTQPSSDVIYNNVLPTPPVPKPSIPTTPILKPTIPTPQTIWQQPTYDNTPYSAPVYQTEPPTYSPVPKPSNWSSNNLGNLDRLPSINAQSNQYSFMGNNSSTDTYSQKTTATNQTNQYSTGYVPPPWESEKRTSFQPSPYYEPQTAPVDTSNIAPIWNSPAPQLNHKRTAPLSYQPPAPNASFVKQASPAPNQTPGRKTYYSEYERRYISVPESTYVPTETKVKPQWDPSPQYYYDNAEPTEQVEQPWRKELREFTEKNTNEESTTAQPPWKEETNYQKEYNATQYSNPPTWSQTLRPRSWREKSYESESLQQIQEWPQAQNKRPVSAFVRNRLNSPSVERTRGVSVDRYNINSYQTPSAYTPSSSNGYAFPWETQQQISTTTTSQFSETKKSDPISNTYHNPQVPTYHVRSTESREYQMSYQPRWSGQGRERPVQSRSFKYLQMLTGTEDGLDEPEPFVVQEPHHAVPKPRRV